MNRQEQGGTQPNGRFAGRVSRDLGELRHERVSLGWRLLNWVKYTRREIAGEIAMNLLGRVYGVVLMRSAMSGVVYRPNLAALDFFQKQRLNELLRANIPLAELPRYFGGLVTEYGVMCRRNVTNTGVDYLCDAFQGTGGAEPELFHFHGLGTGAVAASQTDSALGTEITASHYTGAVRPSGTNAEGGSTNIYRTVGTHTQATAGDTVTEHGIFTATSAGTMLDRHVFTGVALAVNDSFQTTYELTITANG